MAAIIAFIGFSPLLVHAADGSSSNSPIAQAQWFTNPPLKLGKPSVGRTGAGQLLPQELMPTEQPLLSPYGVANWVVKTYGNLKAVSWNPGNGGYSVSEIPFRAAATVGQTAVASGMVFLAVEKEPDKAVEPTVVFVTGSGGVLRAPLGVTVEKMYEHEPGRFSVSVVALADGRWIVLAWGKATDGLSATLWERRGDSLGVTRMPGLKAKGVTNPIATGLADGRLMISGGLGWEAGDATYVLDPQRQAWVTGPSMGTARYLHSAVRLPDGSLLVTGGKTCGVLPARAWNADHSCDRRTSERWDAESNRFQSSGEMPEAMVNHSAVWLPGYEGKELLLYGNGTVLAYSPGAGTWSLIGSGSGKIMVPYRVDGAWRALTGESKHLRVIALRFPAGSGPGLESSVAETGAALSSNRENVAFSPATGLEPAVIAGGWTGAGVSRVVETVDKDGRHRMLPLLNRPRQIAHVFRMKRGLLVLGGAGTSGEGAGRGSKALPAEWLNTEAEGRQEWVTLGDLNVPFTSALAQMPDGNLLEVDRWGNVTVHRFDFAADSPVVTHEAWPPLGLARRGGEFANAHPLDDVSVRVLADGRVIVAGGLVQDGWIAVAPGASSREDNAPGDYVGFGPERLSDTYEIYEPDQKAWRLSAPARVAGGRVAILDDGRVMKLNAGSSPYLEISNAGGTAWSELESRSVLIQREIHAQPIVIEGELFAAGHQCRIPNGDWDCVQWFDQTAQRWVLIWSGERAEGNVGRLTTGRLPNGKTYVLPVDGSVAELW